MKYQNRLILISPVNLQQNFKVLHLNEQRYDAP